MWQVGLIGKSVARAWIVLTKSPAGLCQNWTEIITCDREKRGYDSGFASISQGRRVGQRGRASFSRGAVNGFWLLLCHKLSSGSGEGVRGQETRARKVAVRRLA